MKKKINLIEETKKEIVNNILDSTAFKVTKYVSVALLVTYGLGFVFNILAYTQSNFKKFKRCMNY